ncbi:MAG: hypothetical protein Ta2D_02420 [Rickettsiales bacterium]|nr:MAG: hypothetical protein Ta2D_02420 [Rickettsiales bacterium]
MKKNLVKFCVMLVVMFVSLTTFANASLVEMTLGGYTIKLNNLDVLSDGAALSPGNAFYDDMVNQLKGQGIPNQAAAEALVNGWRSGGGLNNKQLELSVAGEKIILAVDNFGNLTKVRDDFGIFEGMSFAGLNLNGAGLEEFFTNNGGANDFAERFKNNIDALESSGKLYAIFSKLFVKELHRKIAKTPYSAVGGNPLSAMYSMADNDFYSAINNNSVDSYSHYSINKASVKGAEILNVQFDFLDLVDVITFGLFNNLRHSNLFGYLDPLGLSLRFDMPISVSQITLDDGDKIYGGNLGAGVALRWIVPEKWVRDWSLTASYRPLTLALSINMDKMEDMDEDAIMGMEDLSVLPELSVFTSTGFTSKKTWNASFFGWDNDQVKFSMVNSYTMVDSWSKKDIQDVVPSGVFDEKTKQIIPELNLHNSFFKNGVFIEYTPYSKLVLGGGLTYTIVGGETKVYVPSYWTLNLDVMGDVDFWVFSEPTLKLKYTVGSGWGSYGAVVRLSF